MKSKKLFKKMVVLFFGLTMLLPIQGTMGPLKAAVLDEASADAEQEQEWINFQNRYKSKKWKVEWNKKTKTPKKITGGSIKASVFGIATVTEDNMDALAKAFFAANMPLLKITNSDLEIVKLRVNKVLKVISYRQSRSNIPVVSSVVTLVVKKNKIVEFKAKYHTGISISTTPSIVKEEAATIARRFLKDKGKNSEDPSLVIYPLTKGGDYALTYQVVFPVMENPSQEKEKPYIKPTVFVDANTGAIRDVIDNIVYDDLYGTVTGNIYPVFTDTPQVQKPFNNDWIYANGTQGITDQNGRYSFSGLTIGPVNVSAQLKGPWAVVFNEQRDAASHSATISVPGTHDWNWGSYDGSYNQEESNAFYHTNVIHDYITKPSLGVTEMNVPMQVYVNAPYSCNAASSGDYLYFYQSNAYCESTALDAGVIYHEYGHSINAHLVPVSWPYQDQTGNMNEGIADYWGITILNTPCNGRFIYSVACNRPADTFQRYPDIYTSEPHSGAQIISGALWDMRKALGADNVDSLVVDALRRGPTSFSDLAEDILIADDDGGDLSDGTPNIDVICHSFWDLHGIFTEYCADHTQTGIGEITSPAPAALNIINGVIKIKGTAHGTTSKPFGSYTLEYASQNSPGSWSSAGITLTGGEVINGVLGQLDTNSLSEGLYYLRITVTYGSSQYYSYPITITIDKHIKVGWPVNTSNWIGSTPLIGDLDGNGYKDIIMGSYNELYALKYDGTFLPGWGSLWLWATILGKPAIGDIDGNGDKEAVFADVGGHVTAYHHDGTVFWTYWTGAYDYILGSPLLRDINNDGKLETIFGSDNGNLYVLNYQGNLLWSAGTIGKIRSSAAIGDINGDGFMEIVVTSFNYTTKEFKIYIYTRDGAYVTAPISVTLTDPSTDNDNYLRYESAPALADLDNDGHLEIVLGLPDGSIGAWKSDGSLVWRYYDTSLAGVSKIMRSPAIGDIDHDGNLEIVVANCGKAYALHHTGTLVDNWPITRSPYSFSSPVLFDLDGGGDLEIIIPNYKKIGIYRHDGTEIYTDSFITQGYSYGTAAVGDLDNNGKPDIVFGSGDGNIYVWEVDTQVAKPDLVISSVGGPATGVVGSPITVSCTVCNQGTVDIGATFASVVYLSTDATITSTDTPINEVTFPAGLLAGACSGGNVSTTIPAGMAPGTYYIGAIADPYNQIAESNESNNARTGNTITVSSADTIPPTGTIIINSGASYTNTATVTLTLSAKDASGVSQMKFSNDNVTWTTPEAYATSKTWALSAGDGTKTVYVKYKDTPGNWSTATISDTIILDTVGPVSSITAPGYSTDTSANATFTVQWSGTDALSGVSTYDVGYRQWNSSSYTSWVANSAATSKAFTGTAGQTYYFRVRAKDKAGNVGSWTADKSVVVPFDESATNYGGKWSTVSNTSLYRGSAQYATASSAKMTYDFTNAREVSLILTSRNNGGYANIYIGSTLIKTVSFYSASTAYRQRVLVTTYATPTAGTLKIVVNGTKPAGSSGTRVEIDGIGIKR